MKRFLANIALWAFHLCFARPVLRFGASLRYRRKGPLPAGPCIVVSNHNSHLDAAVLMGLFPLRRLPRVHPVAAADYFGKTLLLRTMAMLFMNGIPIERRTRPGSDPLQPILDAIRGGESLIFFPEGSRGEAGVVAPFRPGIGRLVQQLPGLLIVPVYLSGPERIWPRGEPVPVPLSIDAIVGKARSYDPQLDPKEIAEAVQRDVLALAPPPPPRPAPRPAPPLRIAVCGVEAESRMRVFREIAAHLGRLDATLGLSEPLVEADAQGLREVTGPIVRSQRRTWLSPLAWLFRTSGRFEGAKFAEMVERAALDEAMGAHPTTRYLVTEGSPLVDLLAWAEADFYKDFVDDSGMGHLLQYLSGQTRIPVSRWWRFIRRAPEVWLINVFDLVRPPVPDVLVHVRSPVGETMRGLRQRGVALDPHENETFLSKLQSAYSEVGLALRKRRKVEWIESTGGERDVAELLQRIEALARRRLEPKVADG